ncbi:hypothetical protein DBT_1371 [Dissulfuribacter thermophilus]|uniref:PD-(D/E)XK endonuclease-like domain-containing protein n=1 Tax=Dissulfuribacter thermophilus TaxID=1156395 RepID=A0A1B9F5M2_9BACT|nr:hypothetical protein [Dissulfuribacter thermophilus]OCC15248.1 hypothetical protein DBT_1371 [Dissulfuribacter thermophilus]
MLGDLGSDTYASLRSRKKGRLLHQALYFVEKKEDLLDPEPLVKKAFCFLGERVKGWDLKGEFVLPLKNLLNLPEVDIIFPNAPSLVLKEREFLVPKGKDGFFSLRPDRVIIKENEAIIIEFKSEGIDAYLKKKHQEQVLTYRKIVEKSFGLSTVGYLVYLIENLCEQVRFSYE